MDIFAFRQQLVDEYKAFSRSFATIRAKDILQVVDRSYREGRHCPSPLMQLNPGFAPGGSIEEMVARGDLEEECSRIFRLKREGESDSRPLALYRHQADAIEVARSGRNHVLVTCTGSGKSLGYFIPIVNHVLEEKRAGRPSRGITAIVVYPMNALCNSQLAELHKFLSLGYPEGREPVSFARYTGQEKKEERERIARNPPDILLTNYMMLELIMTRFQETDRAVRRHAQGLGFLVLDEIHTYRGRQGADVAMLVRRIRERFNDHLICIGTSATMASEGTIRDRNEAVATVATDLFGRTVSPDNIIRETLVRVTRGEDEGDGAQLRAAVERSVDPEISWEELSRNPLARWVEMNLGLEREGENLIRVRNPLSLEDASRKLASRCGLEEEDCRKRLEEFLLKASRVRNRDGRVFFAFRLHQFISSAGNIYATLEAENDRYLTLDGQKYKPGDRKRPLFPLCFCRGCGQEYHPVLAEGPERAPRSFQPRELSHLSRDEKEEDLASGYLMPDPGGTFDDAEPEKSFPPEWLESFHGKARIRGNRRRHAPAKVRIDTRGQVLSEDREASEGLDAWFLPGSFRFCLNPECSASFRGGGNEMTKLSGLSSEGRSSASTMLMLTALRGLMDAELDEESKKVLGFIDNRQDASLQAGHFNDFMHILLLRSALLSAIRANEVLTDEDLSQKVFHRLQLDIGEYASSPDAKGNRARNTQRTLRDVIGYRLYQDLRRGWRITTPNLEQLGLLEIRYRDLDACCGDQEEWEKSHQVLAGIAPGSRRDLVLDLLHRMRRELCIKTLYLEPEFQERMYHRSHTELREPWGFSEDEDPHMLATCKSMIPRPRKGRGNDRFRHVSWRSDYGRRLREGIPGPIKDEDSFNAVIDGILRVLEIYGIVQADDQRGDLRSYRLVSSAMEWRAGTRSGKDSANSYFHGLYEAAAAMLGRGACPLRRLEAREHTAQVENEVRVKREERFRMGMNWEEKGLPLLFCSPTMELGVDIATLNTVFMRNIPPTSANYTQRSGRAGRSGQPALVATYCSSRSPHDQHFFDHPRSMVAGEVNPPWIDLANEDLIRSHIHAVWLTETDAILGDTVPEVLDADDPELPLRSPIRKQLESARATERTRERARRLMESLKDRLGDDAAPWHRPGWLDAAINSARKRFDAAFDRWRSLQQATRKQLERADRIVKSIGTSEKQRQAAMNRYKEAYQQMNLLNSEQKTVHSDFHTYRYLASEGFLPGYNFPRLPLMAYIPGRSFRGSGHSFLTRPRFLGLHEFGPRSLIYHEGSTYRVQRTILTARDREGGNELISLPVQSARLCPECGYGHFGDQRDHERCVHCDSSLDGGKRIQNLYRIEQVSTRRENRITSDVEDRQRQRYEMITTLRFSEDKGEPRRNRLALGHREQPLLEMQYAQAATLWRINLGWMRRKEKSIHGFPVDPDTGEWESRKDLSIAEAADSILEGVPGKISKQAITPYVEDTRNVLLLQPQAALSPGALLTLQYALKRSIEQVFQLEEAELAAEPLPHKEERKAILFYEAAEGGAGVLIRLINDPEAVRHVAVRALEICHYRPRSEKWTDREDLLDLCDAQELREEKCEAGCYRCLLSYHNQLDHSSIDRSDPEMLDFLCRLAKSSPIPFKSRERELRNVSNSSLEQAWLDHIQDRGLRLPERGQQLVENRTRPDFSYPDHQTLIYIDGPHHQDPARQTLDAEQTLFLEERGYTVVRFPQDRSSWDGIIRRHPWIFGTPSSPES